MDMGKLTAGNRPQTAAGFRFQILNFEFLFGVRSVMFMGLKK